MTAEPGSLRITTWNVNGIRNPFSYPPWRDRRTFEAMFDILESDIICLQETKIQRKDLRDDMVLVPGFDCYWSLPRHKKGYSGVVIYTRNSKCAPIRAEEGITGVLCPPNTEVSFKDLSEEERIGGYPTREQLEEVEIDAATLDAEGRCVVLEFPAFVLLGTYCPAERDETRTHFRTAFLRLLDSRIRNLVKMGKRVVWIGDLNISSNAIDTAMAEEMQRKNGVDHAGWVSTPARRLFNQLIVEGEVYGERDEGREEQVMWDVCRDFHRDRRGMYTCWETKVNARPGNFGARIDYVVSSYNMREWWADSNIQEGLHGSDHCPVYGVLKEKVVVDGKEEYALDLMNPEGMFVNGVRKQDWTTRNLLPMSGRLIPEFDKRRNIKDMFTKKPALAPPISFMPPSPQRKTGDVKPTSSPPKAAGTTNSISPPTIDSTNASPRNNMKRKSTSTSLTSEQPPKKSKVESTKGQQSLKGFFVPKLPLTDTTPLSPVSSPEKDFVEPSSLSLADSPAPTNPSQSQQSTPDPAITSFSASFDDPVNAVASTEHSRKSWSKLFSRPVAPKCEHDEPCKTMLTKKPGVNCGRSFWMCARPLGPSGQKERGTQWRCQTFIWCSDWDARQKEQENG